MTTFRLKRLLVIAIPIPLWLLLAYVLFAPLLHDLSGPLPGGADSILFSWYFKEIQVSLWNGHNPLFTTAMNAPTGLNVMWNTALLLPAVLMSPITAIFGATTTVGLVMIAAPLAAASIAYWVLYRMSNSLSGAAAGATLYGFGPFYNGQQGHVHLTVGAVFLPLILYYGYLLFTSDAYSYRQLGWRLGAVVGVTMLIAEEIVAIAAAVALVSVIALALRYRREIRPRLPKIAKGVGWAAAIAFCVCGPALLYQFLGPLPLTEGLHSSLALDLLSSVRPGSTIYFSTAADAVANRRFPADGVENTGYLGIILILAVVLACVLLFRTNQRRLVYWLATTAVLAFALSLGTTVRVNGLQTYVPMPWVLFSRMPVIDTLVPARFSVATLLIVATILAFGMAALPKLGADRRGRIIRSTGYAVVAAALVACWPAAGGADRLQITTPAFFTSAAVDAIPAGAVVLALPQPPSANGAAAVMKWQIDANMRFAIIGGYSFFSRNGKPHYDADMPTYARVLGHVAQTGSAPTPDQASIARQSVVDSVGDYVIVTDQVAHPAPLLAALPQIAGCVPQRVSDVYLCKISR